MAYLTDIEIARAAKLKPIVQIAAKAGIGEESLEPYGRYKAKVNYADVCNKTKKNGKLILVTAITPTPAGEGENHHYHRSCRRAEFNRQKRRGGAA